MSADKVVIYECGFKSTDTDPCKDCPRLASALHMCGILQEAVKKGEDRRQIHVDPKPRI